MACGRSGRSSGLRPSPQRPPAGRHPAERYRRSGRSPGPLSSCGDRLPARTRGKVPQNCAPCKSYRQQRKRSRPITWDGICDLVVPPKFRRENLRGSARRPGNGGQTARLVSAHAPGWWDIAALCRVLAPYGRSLWAKTASRPHQRFMSSYHPRGRSSRGFLLHYGISALKYTICYQRNATEKLLRLVSPAGREISSGISVRSLTWPSSAGTPCQGSRQT